MNDQKAERVYVDKWGDEIDLSVIYGVYKTPSGLTGFFQRCTTYNPVEIQQAVSYIVSNVSPRPYDQANARRMMKQIEGSVPAQHRQQLNGFLIAAIVVLFAYIGFLIYSKMTLVGAHGMIDSIDSSGFAAIDNMKSAMTGTFGTLDMLVNINIGLVTASMFCDCVASGLRKRGWALASAALCLLSLLTFAGNALFAIAAIALTLIAWEQMKDDE